MKRLLYVALSLIIGASLVTSTFSDIPVLADPGTTETLRPIGPGSQTGWSSQYPSGGAHWDKVDEVIADDTVTYISADTVPPWYYRDLYELSNLTVGDDIAIDFIKVYGRVKSGWSPYAPGAYNSIGTNGQTFDYQGPNIPDTGYLTFSVTLNKNPATGVVWTKSDINNLEAGVYCITTSTWGYQATQVYVEVTYSTLPPTNFTANTTSSSQINLAWAPPAEADQTLVRQRTNTFPTSITDGDQTYLGSASNYNVTSLTRATTYYFSAWSYNATYGYSTLYATSSNTTLAIAPTVNTESASNLAKTTARLNAVLTDDGGETCDVRFGYSINSTVNFADYDYITEWAEGFTTGNHPYYDASGLSANTTYYFNVQAKNSSGNHTGDERSFSTTSAVSDPSGFGAYPTATSVSLSWVSGDGSTQSLVRYAAGGFPSSTDNGTLVYLGISSSYTHIGLTPGTTYYYSVWGESGGDYSSGYDTVMVTTSAAEAAGEDLPTPTTPSRWLTAPEYTNLSNLPIVYDAVNRVADSMEMPRATLWMMLALIGAVGFGIVIYMVSGGKMMLGMIALILALNFGWAIKIVPFWIPLITLILIVGTKVMHREAQY